MNRLGVTYECDRQTDGHTLRQQVPRCTKLRSQNRIQTPEPSSSRNTDTYGSSLAVKSISSLKHEKRAILTAFHNIINANVINPMLILHTYSPYL